MPVSEAIKVLGSSGLAPGDVIYRRAPGREPNRVIGTNPAPGTTVDAGSRVHVVAAR
jgi:beta-lactam-binding protein with PASTA domain